MRFRIMRFSIYAEVRSSKIYFPFMRFSNIILHLCGFKNMNFLYFVVLFRETAYHCLSLQKSILVVEVYNSYLHINEGIKGSWGINGSQNILKIYMDFFSPYMQFSHYAVFLRKQKTHKQRTKPTFNTQIMFFDSVK